MYRLSKLVWIIIASFSPWVEGSEPAKTNPEKQAHQPEKAVPFENYWDSNSWEPGSSSTFWHSIKDDQQSEELSRANQLVQHLRIVKPKRLSSEKKKP